jgi:hypothetical protein
MRIKSDEKSTDHVSPDERDGWIKVPITEMALQRCMAMEIRWNKNDPSRGASPVAVNLSVSMALKDCPESLISQEIMAQDV